MRIKCCTVFLIDTNGSFTSSCRTTKTSLQGLISGKSGLTHSRSLRFSRLRTTAPPTFLLIENPTRTPWRDLSATNRSPRPPKKTLPEKKRMKALPAPK